MTRAPFFPVANWTALGLSALVPAAATTLIAHDPIQFVRGCAPGDTDCRLRMADYRGIIAFGAGAWLTWLRAAIVAWRALSRRVALARGEGGWLAIVCVQPMIVAAHAVEVAV